MANVGDKSGVGRRVRIFTIKQLLKLFKKVLRSAAFYSKLPIGDINSHSFIFIGEKEKEKDFKFGVSLFESDETPIAEEILHSLSRLDNFFAPLGVTKNRDKHRLQKIEEHAVKRYRLPITSWGNYVPAYVFSDSYWVRREKELGDNGEEEMKKLYFTGESSEVTPEYLFNKAKQEKINLPTVR